MCHRPLVIIVQHISEIMLFLERFLLAKVGYISNQRNLVPISTVLKKTIYVCTIIRPSFHGQFSFDKVGLSQKNMLV